MSPGLRMTSSMRPATGAAMRRACDSRHFACSSSRLACSTWLSAALIASARAGSPPPPDWPRPGRPAPRRSRRPYAASSSSRLRWRCRASSRSAARAMHALGFRRPAPRPSAPRPRARRSPPAACRAAGRRAAPRPGQRASALATAIFASPLSSVANVLPGLDPIAAPHRNALDLSPPRSAPAARTRPRHSRRPAARRARRHRQSEAAAAWRTGSS